MTRLGKENAAERLAAIIRGESNGMAHYYVALDGANEGEIKALSDALAEKLSAFVIPTDAFLLPSRNLTPERAALPGGPPGPALLGPPSEGAGKSRDPQEI